jgi:hypothetical protein
MHGRSETLTMFYFGKSQRKIKVGKLRRGWDNYKIDLKEKIVFNRLR